MAGEQNSVENALEKLALENANVPDHIQRGFTTEYLELLQKFHSTIVEIDPIYNRLDAASTRFRRCIERLKKLSKKAIRLDSMDLSANALESKRTARSYDRDRLHPFLLHLGESRRGLQTKAMELQSAPNLDRLLKELDNSQQLLSDAGQEEVVCESKFSELDGSISDITSVLEQ